MNGYRARVERRRQMNAQAVASGEKTAVSSFDWVTAAVDGIADAVEAATRHEHEEHKGAPGKAQPHRSR
jgi:hypothetical protein